MNLVLTNHSWENMDWKKIENELFELQILIYKASALNDVYTVRNIQNQVINSLKFKRLAVKRVTMSKNENKINVDNVFKLNNKEKSKLADQIEVGKPSDNIKRVYIPNGISAEIRPFEIPTLKYKATQMLVVYALEPEWEAKFEKNNYGFQRGRSAKDAVWSIKHSLREGPKFIYYGDIKKSFDNINQKVVLRKLNMSSNNKIYKQVKLWLKSKIINNFDNVIEKKVLQKGSISPLICNVLLDELEEIIQKNLEDKYSLLYKKKRVKIVRYFDNFVIISPSIGLLETSVEAVKRYLQILGLEINENKTKILSLPCDILTFLGFDIKIIKKGKHRQTKLSFGRKTQYSVILTPAKNKVKKLKIDIRDILKKNRDAERTILKLNSRIIKWCWYYANSDILNVQICSKINYWLIRRIIKWQRKVYRTGRRVPYLWETKGNNKWIFSVKRRISKTEKSTNRISLINLAKIIKYSSTRHVTIKKRS